MPTFLTLRVGAAHSASVVVANHHKLLDTREGRAESPLFVEVAPVEQQVVVDAMLARQPSGTDAWLHLLFNQRQLERQREVGSTPLLLGFDCTVVIGVCNGGDAEDRDRFLPG